MARFAFGIRCSALQRADAAATPAAPTRGDGKWRWRTRASRDTMHLKRYKAPAVLPLAQPESAMRLALFGPTGGTGRLLLDGALAAGHQVIAYTRRADAIAPLPGLAVCTGTLRDTAKMNEALAGTDAVLCALGGRPWRRTERVCSSAARAILPAMQHAGVRRIVAISTFGAGDSRPQTGWAARALLFGLVLRSEVADKEAMEEQLAASGLDWTAVRIGVLHDGAGSGEWRAADDGSIVGMGKIARADVAAFMLGELQRGEWIRRRPVLVQLRNPL
jgi:putative NADH-flavin reductase